MHLTRVLVGLGLALAGCTNLPRDPELTLERIKNQRRIRVGITEHPPWVIRTFSGEPAGAEVELVRRLSSELGATPDWYWGSETQHMRAASKFELDLVIAGLDADAPWSEVVGLTRPYFEERILVGVPPSESVPGALDGVTVAIHRGESAAAKLIEHHAKPHRVPEIVPAIGIAA